MKGLVTFGGAGTSSMKHAPMAPSHVAVNIVPFHSVTFWLQVEATTTVTDEVQISDPSKSSRVNVIVAVSPSVAEDGTMADKLTLTGASRIKIACVGPTATRL